MDAREVKLVKLARLHSLLP